ncbi:hypothetical protein [Streptosporangium sp. NPDC051022]|uniref:hypothetical protein n=1 Tax=Streptosporangium sp. NPDC051022 TaxID=3155752 RepID=UPI00342A87DE
MIGLRSPRTAGRHRAGQPRTTVHRRLWDGPARAEAERLERSWPAWLVLYSLGGRRFYALGSWPTPQPVIVEGDTAASLEERMRETETTLTWRALPTSPPTLTGPILTEPNLSGPSLSGRGPSPDRHGRSRPPASAVTPYPSRRPHRDAA